MIQKSYAKINLVLNVTDKRPDGYHNLDMVMLPIELHDSLSITPLRNHSDNFITFADYSVIDKESNLVTRAVNLLAEKKNISTKFRVVINKVVPLSAGLGGGSSNAAATLLGISRFMKIPVDIKEYQEMGLTLGSDIPFFIECVPARVKGVGEKLEPIHIAKDYWVLIVKPSKGLSTKLIYEEADTMPINTYNAENVVKALAEGDDDLLKENIGNSLEKAAIKMLPEIQEIKDVLKSKGLDIVLMSGSGSSVFAMCSDKKKIKRVYKEIEDDYECYFTKVIRGK